jgi:hypothetical protein
MNAKGKLTVAAAGLLIVAAAAYWFLFYPKILLKNTFHEMVSAFENEEVNTLIDYFSSDYRDESNMLRADVEDFLVFFFEQRENIRCDVAQTKMLVHGKKATVQVWGEIHFQTRDGEKTISLRDTPLVLIFARERNGWRMVDVGNGATMLE